MARLPAPSPPDGSTHSFSHDAVALYFFVACVAATVALVSSMCSACGRKPKAAAASDQPTRVGSVSDGSHADNQKAGAASEEEAVVTLSPELATHGPIAPVAMPSSTSKRRLSLSISLSKNLSMNIPDKMRLWSMNRSMNRKEHKVESEDTLWKKGIILGEKCKIPGERDGEAGDGVDPADELAAGSFRRSSYSRPMSRSSSFAMHQQHDAPALCASHS
ncbi:uncharacterized protein LOC133926247 [Phragmites australis]|uniref:uncharacterized protein LOC133926247 n=1 Tax=Phragmites australis TaxID=29695 RepID=UPI002D78BE72|nr:uncharacterized protein LOC133926247 [Phragmites australis]